MCAVLVLARLVGTRYGEIDVSPANVRFVSYRSAEGYLPNPGYLDALGTHKSVRSLRVFLASLL